METAFFARIKKITLHKDYNLHWETVKAKITRKEGRKEGRQSFNKAYIHIMDH